MIGPAGTIVCWVTTQPQYASLYPGCVPTNIVDPNGPSVSSYNYLRQRTSWVLDQKLDNIGASIGGGLWGIGLAAGEIKANISTDVRWATYEMDSDFSPTDYVNCTGLRMCLANSGAPVRWVQNTNASVEASNRVFEAALEVNIPLLKDLPFAQEVSTNWAGRYTKYSSFAAVESWKGGIDWHVNDTIRFRATSSMDIRAPNLNDLYQPAGVSSTGFSDLLTNTTNNLRLISRGNPDLTPEKARTLTVGVVLTPSFIANFNLSVDYYQSKITDAITAISYQNTNIQNLCLASAPSYNSPFCALAIRPITDPTDPNYRTSANFPTEILNSPLNAARQETHGYDFQFNYGWEMGPGRVSLRHLVSYQPVNETVSLPGAFPTWAVAPKTRQSTFLSYATGDWDVSLQNQWLSSVSLKSSDNALNGNSQNYADSSLPSYDVVDFTLAKRFQREGSDSSIFLTVSNVTNERAPLYPSNSGIPGLFYPTLGFYDDMGRYFTVGYRKNM